MVTHDYGEEAALRVKLLDLDAWRVIGASGLLNIGRVTCASDADCPPYYDCHLKCADEGQCAFCCETSAGGYHMPGRAAMRGTTYRAPGCGT